MFPIKNNCEYLIIFGEKWKIAKITLNKIIITKEKVEIFNYL